MIFTQHLDTIPPLITLDRADPHVLVNDEVLNVVCTHPREYMWLTSSPRVRYCEPPCYYPSHPFCWSDWLLHLDIAGRRLVYRIGTYRLAQNAWEASWPD